MTEQKTPNADQLTALQIWKKCRGRYWKRSLLIAWERSGAGFAGYSPELQQLRNNFGPAWLVKFKLPKEATHEQYQT